MLPALMSDATCVSPSVCLTCLCLSVYGHLPLAQISRNSVGNKTPRSKTRFRKFPWKSDPFREKIQTSVLDLALGTPQNLEMPLRASEFCDFRCKKAQIIEKIARCAPPRRHQTRPISGLSPRQRPVKSEDPAKITYSIPDFLNRERKRRG